MDNVNPSHYKDKAIETIDCIYSALGHQGTIDYCNGNVIKYVSRWRQKNGIEDLKKAQWYLNKAISYCGKTNQPSVNKVPDWLTFRGVSESPFQAPKEDKTVYYFGNPDAHAA